MMYISELPDLLGISSYHWKTPLHLYVSQVQWSCRLHFQIVPCSALWKGYKMHYYWVATGQTLKDTWTLESKVCKFTRGSATLADFNNTISLLPSYAKWIKINQPSKSVKITFTVSKAVLEMPIHGILGYSSLCLNNSLLTFPSKNV